MAKNEAAVGDEVPKPKLDPERHRRYFTRCLRALLPQQYTGNDSTRMALGFFIISGIDLLSGEDGSLGANPSPLSLADRQCFRDWVLSCQHDGGGFCGSTTHTLPKNASQGWDYENHCPELENSGCSNIAATAFALLLLALLADKSSAESAFSGVDRLATLRWLRKLQRPDGSFGEVLVDIPRTAPETIDVGGTAQARQAIAGGRDMRYCYLAAIIRWILRGDDLNQGDANWVQDIDVEALVRHIRAGQTFDGGVAESSMHESHAGYAYCAISTLSLLKRPLHESKPATSTQKISDYGVHVPSLVRFLVSRQTSFRDAPIDDDNADEDDSNFYEPQHVSRHSLPSNYPPLVGFNGRVNKAADTCYCWWVCASLELLRKAEKGRGDGMLDVAAQESARRFLTEKTQHMIGGFSKNPGGPPDIYHAYFGLSALAVLRDPELKDFDAGLCVSKDTIEKIEAGRDGLQKRYSTVSSDTSSATSSRPRPYINELLGMGEALMACKLKKAST